MQLLSIKTKVLESKPINTILDQIETQSISIDNGDVLVLTSKIISYDEQQIIKLTDFTPSAKAKQLAAKYDLDANFCQIVLEESDEIIGGVKKAILTRKDNRLIANAGADLSNVPLGYVALWPQNPAASAQTIKDQIQHQFNREIGIIISDSHCVASRHGTTGFALAIAGFCGLISEIGETDLFDKPLKITYHNVADELAASANFLMGESSQKTPAVLIKNPGITLSTKSAEVLTNDLLIPKTEDLYKQL